MIEIEPFENGNDFSETLTRVEFEELNTDLFRETMKPVERVESSRCPLVRKTATLDVLSRGRTSVVTGDMLVDWTPLDASFVHSSGSGLSSLLTAIPEKSDWGWK